VKTVGVLSIVYGVVLSLFWVVTGLWLAAHPNNTPANIAAALGFGAVAVMLVFTGVALCRAAAGRGTPTRPIAFVTAGCLAAKAAFVGYLAAKSLRATGSMSGLDHIIGWILLVVVVVPSLVWALALLWAVSRSWARPAEADDYDDARPAPPEG
jgi:hypothetical protein